MQQYADVTAVTATLTATSLQRGLIGNVGCK